MTENPNDPFGAERDDKDYAGKNLVKLGLSAPLFKPPPGHTYLFRTPSLEKEWQDSFTRTATPPSPSPSASGLETSPERQTPEKTPYPFAPASRKTSGQPARLHLLSRQAIESLELPSRPIRATPGKPPPRQKPAETSVFPV